MYSRNIMENSIKLPVNFAFASYFQSNVPLRGVNYMLSVLDGVLEVFALKIGYYPVDNEIYNITADLKDEHCSGYKYQIQTPSLLNLRCLFRRFDCPSNCAVLCTWRV